MENVQYGLGTSKKRKRGERMFRFTSFCEPGHPIHFDGSFQENIKALLGFGHPEGIANGGAGIQCWSFRLELHQYPSTYVRLFVAEESVEMAINRRQCQFCRSVGWGHHMICNKRFHFVLPSKGTAPQLESLSDEVSGKGSDKAPTASRLMSSQGHLMHGVVHSNGYGHLLCVNGIEGGSDFVSGHQILHLWDRICAFLKLRKVSVTDSARKGTMELRLIHGLAYGEPWFGQWGYQFGHGSYGITQQTYQASLEALRSLPLFLLVPHLVVTGKEIPIIIAKYQALSGQTLQTLGDLIRFMLELNRRLPLHSPTTLDYHGLIAESTCRWSMKRVEMAAQVIVEALKKSQLRWVTRQEVRDAARAYIGDTGLLDYVLKSLGNHIVGNYIVRRMVNPVTKVLEYCLQDISSSFPRLDGLGSVRVHVTRVLLVKELLHLYKNILVEPVGTAGVFAAIPIAVRIVLDVKHLVKDYSEWRMHDMHAAGSEVLKVMCTVQVRGDRRRRKELPETEVVRVPISATVGDLKREVERVFKGLYWGLKGFVAEKVVGFNGDDCELVLGSVDPGSVVVVEGRGGEEVYEGGDGEGVVNCLCGAKEEDGERMVCCDICEVWQHMRCVRIGDDGGGAPRVFLCNRCEDDIVALPSIHY